MSMRNEKAREIYEETSKELKNKVSLMCDDAITNYYQPLFDHMYEEHGLILTLADMEEIIRIVNNLAENELRDPSPRK